MQDFGMVDISMRRMTSELWYLKKMFGSRDLSATKPPPRFVYGLIIKRELDPRDYDENDKKFISIIPEFTWIDKETTGIFDTRQQIFPGESPDMEHIDKRCSVCGITKTVHY